MTGVDAFERYAVNEITGCWLWQGYVNRDGYARLESQNAHRLYFVHHGGEIPEGWDVDHLCKRRDCVNPDHMEAVPEIVNIRRGKFRHVSIDGQDVRICREGHLVRGRNMAKAGRGKHVCWLCAVRAPSGARPVSARRLAAMADASPGT